MRRSAAESREHVLGVASDLFYRNGIRATGVDEIAKVADVAPTTLYRAFGSKDDLAAAYVANNDAKDRQWINAAIEAAGPTARDQILAVFTDLAHHMRSAGFQGCGCMKALAEFPNPRTPTHANAVAAKKWSRATLRTLVRRHANQISADLDEAQVADQLTLLFEGTLASAAALGGRGPARHAAAAAAAILDAAEANSRSSIVGPSASAT